MKSASPDEAGPRKVIIPAAGLGTRFLPATKAQPKEMLPVFDKPAIQYVVEEAVQSGVRDIVVVTGRNKQAIENHFDRSLELEEFLARQKRRRELSLVKGISRLANLIYIRQKEPRGLGHAVLCCRTLVSGEPFGLQLADDLIESRVPALLQLWRIFRRFKGTVVALMKIRPSEVSSYGIAAGKWVAPGVMRVSRLVEKPSPARAPSRYAIVGRYILSPGLMPVLQGTRPGTGGEVQLTDAISKLARREPVFGYCFDGRRYDTGNKLGYVEASLAYALKDPRVGPGVRRLLGRHAGRCVRGARCGRH